MRALRLLREAGIPFHVITVISAASLGAADRLFDFYVEQGIRDVAFNIDEQDGAAGPSSLASPGMLGRYRAFLDRFLERLAAAPGLVTLREATDMLAVIRMNGLHGRRAQDAEPMRIVSVAVDGRVSTFSPELLGVADARYGDFVFGNVVTDSLESIYQRVARSAMLTDINAGIENCARECVYFRYCGGGSPCNKIGEKADLRATETLFCRLMRKEMLESVLALLEREMLAAPIANGGRAPSGAPSRPSLPRLDLARPG